MLDDVLFKPYFILGLGCTQMCALKLKLQLKFFTDAVKVNILGVFHGCQVAFDFLIHGGIVVNIGSIVGLMPMSIAPVYTATKAAVIAYTRYCYFG